MAQIRNMCLHFLCISGWITMSAVNDFTQQVGMRYEPAWVQGIWSDGSHQTFTWNMITWYGVRQVEPIIMTIRSYTWCDHSLITSWDFIHSRCFCRFILTSLKPYIAMKCAISDTLLPFAYNAPLLIEADGQSGDYPRITFSDHWPYVACFKVMLPNISIHLAAHSSTHSLS